MEILELENIGKKYFKSENDRSLDNLHSNVSMPKRDTAHFWAVKNINMKIFSSEIVGIIGRNGAGKTTLLKIIGGVILPTQGRVRRGGKICSIFTLGAGFQNELSGKENVYLNGNILGMSNKYIEKSFQDILDYSELNQVINRPLGTYSKGMKLRLGFSIAIHAPFDILLLDETFLVGDIAFKNKCFDSLLQMKEKGKTILFVTQAMEAVKRLCDRTFLIEGGELIFEGDSHEGVNRYYKLLNKKKFFQRRTENFVTETKQWVERMEYWGSKNDSSEIKIKAVRILNRWGMKAATFKPNSKIKIKVDFEVFRDLNDVSFGVALFREDGVYCYGPNTRWDGYRISLSKGKGKVVFSYDGLFLAPGTYYISIALWDKDYSIAYFYHRGCYRIKIKGKNPNGKVLNLPYKWKPLPLDLQLLRKEILDIEKILQKENYKDEKEDIKIKEVKFLDDLGRQKKRFYTNEEMNVKTKLEILDKKRLKLWIGIFREDDVFCEGASRYVNSPTINLIFPELRLLPGKYKVCVSIWDVEKNDVILSDNSHHFRTIFDKKDHGTVYLPHSWNLKLPENSKITKIS